MFLDPNTSDKDYFETGQNSITSKSIVKMMYIVHILKCKLDTQKIETQISNLPICYISD